MKNVKAASKSGQEPLVRVQTAKKERVFDVEDPKLPDWIEDGALPSGGFPYNKKLNRETYEATLEALQIELVKMQAWMQTSGHRVLALFEGRDAAGKGGTINATRDYLNPRTARNVALPKPTETERGQWYFQRYVTHFPTSGEFVTFDRSWYNRAGVEPVMGFCTPEQHASFLMEAEHFERRIVNDGIHFFKFWLDIGQEMQLKRFHDRRHSQLKSWKFSPIDIAGMNKWDDYTKARDEMFEHTHSEHAPWIIIRSNDKRRARIELIRYILLHLPYSGRDDKLIGAADPKIIGEGPQFLGL
ncbi:polyphosphate kinase 2 [Mesorhizobium sp. NBSH29]|uniref:polyphosphate kinase 2 n=1 Tax=Mesorhizobium sp. NBSH29 TaxID=2654249 RepID=UPI001896855D|nr:polyphosphate kinase 2 [Mesorhizobium sp. NBSH29]QPC86728.1 polyphosphate kinase 2 [Mesorhizobium sp. NBSH29]